MIRRQCELIRDISLRQQPFFPFHRAWHTSTGCKQPTIKLEREYVQAQMHMRVPLGIMLDMVAGLL